ncbi:CYP-29A3 protein [Aphelenchoides avenae]|nr:CYP-29A3 protein [Aphelenchus avenae]
MAEFMIRTSHDAIRRGENIMRLWVGNRLAVIPLNGEALRPIVESNTEIGKGPNYDFYKLWLGESIVTTSLDDRWRLHRKKLTPVFFFRPIRAYVTIFDNHAKRLVDVFDGLANGPDVDLMPLFKRVALDIVAETAMGIRLDALYDENHPFIRATDEFGTLMWKKWKNPLYWSDIIWELSGERPPYSRSARRAEGNVGNGPKLPNFLDILLADKDKDALLFQDLCEQLDTIAHGGYETSAHAFGWTVWCLATHPDVQDRVYDELRSVLWDGKVALTLDMLNDLKYLDICIKEAMRVFPTVPFVERTLRQDTEMGGKLVPKGSMVLISPLVVHHNCKTYPDHDVFNPDNFLPERTANRHAYDYMPFSAGPRNCIGQKFANVELRVVLAHLLLRFRFVTDLKMHDNARHMESMLRPALGCPVRIIRR